MVHPRTGKSSLLDLLAGRKIGKGIRGSVTINGKAVTTDTSSQYFAYVAQEDVFVATLSVWEALAFYTELSLPGDFTSEQRKGRMRAVLRTMGLEKVTNSKASALDNPLQAHSRCFIDNALPSNWEGSEGCLVASIIKLILKTNCRWEASCPEAFM